jgi:transcriptional regulator with XRE-family HTH domain
MFNFDSHDNKKLTNVDSVKLGKRISDYVSTSGLSKKQFANMCGVSHSTICAIASGTYGNRINKNRLDRIEDALKTKAVVVKKERVGTKLGRQIAKHCKDQSITQKEFSKLAGVSRTTVCELINGTHKGRFQKKDIEQKIKMALSAGVTKPELVTRDARESSTVWSAVKAWFLWLNKKA